jgi:hypothetical protein
MALQMALLKQGIHTTVYKPARGKIGSFCQLIAAISHQPAASSKKPEEPAGSSQQPASAGSRQ